MTELRRITERYRLEKQIASSDAGSVFRGTDIQSGETVAVKLINSDGGESEEQRERFLESAGALKALRHPCVPRVTDFGFTTAGSAFLVTEYLEGFNFQDLAGSAPVRVLSLLVLLVDGLEAMARQGITAPNLRAENLLVAPGAEGEQIKILGLGSAILEPGTVPVLDGYPEALRAFGLLACQMLRVQTDIKVGIPLEVAVELEDIEALRALLEAALRGDPGRLYPSYEEVRKALRLALFGQTGRKAIQRTETFATHPGTAGEGTRAGTVVVRRPQAGWDDAPAPQAPDGEGTRPGILPVAAPAAPSTPAGGTVILGSLGSAPWAPAKPSLVPPPEPEKESLDGTMMLTEDLLWHPPAEPLSESRAGGTTRIQLPADPRTRAFVPPVLPEPPFVPEPPALPELEIPAPTPVQRLPETVEIPVALVPPPPPPRRKTATAETPLAFKRETPPPAPPPPPPVAVEPEPLWTPPPPLPLPPPLPPPVVVAPEPERPSPPPPSEFGEETIARPPEVRVVPAAVPVPAAARRPRSLLLKVGIPAAAILVVGISVALAFLLRGSPKPPPKPRAVVVKPVPPPTVVVPPPAPAPLPVHPQIVVAETYLGAGDLNGVKTAINAIPPAEQEAFRPDEQERYQRLVAALAPLQREALASDLSRGLDRGDLRLLRNAANSVSAEDQAALPPDIQKNLARARKALDIDSRLSRAQKSGNPLEVIRQADALLLELPRATRASEQKERAASGIETAADSEIEAGQFDAALNRLSGLRQAWPDRAGLEARINRVAAERKSDQDLESLLAAVSRSEKDNKPLEGLKLLSGVKPNHRYADRFQEARKRLEGEFAQLDRRPPELALRGTVPEYEKGKTATIPLRITDDLGVKTVEGWARPEGGQYANVTVRHLSGADYVMDVMADLHENKTVEYYATATDASGHSGQLGTADHPLKLKKRKNLFEKILGKKDGAK